MRKTLNSKPKVPRERRPEWSEPKLRHILVPLDFSDMSRQALACAVPLARKHRAIISLVHVVPPPIVMGLPAGGIQIPMNVKELLLPARTHLKDLATKLLPAGLRGRTFVTAGSPAYEINSVAKALKADLIVLSTHGFTGLTRVLLGSTAEQIVRHASCPVLTVRRKPGAPARQSVSQSKPDYPERLPWQRILVPLDFSPSSLRALPTAVALARRHGARLLLLNVVEPSHYATGMEGAVLVMPNAAITRNTRSQLSQVARRFVPKSMRVTSLVSPGRAANVILETAEQKDVDLIVMSTHGHSGLGRFLMGSTAEQIVRHAKCPVFVVRKTAG